MNFTLIKYLYRTPLLSFKELVFALAYYLTKKNKGAELKYWQRKGQSLWLISRSTWSIAIIVLLHLHKQKKRKVKIWFPGYYCGATTDVIKKLSVEIKYYKINKSLEPNIEYLNKLLESGPPDIIVLVHHLGNSVGLNEVKIKLEQFKTWVIEDATQCFLPTEEMGMFSHFVLFSPYKFLPIPYGAILVMTKKGKESSGLNEIIFGKTIFKLENEYRELIQPSLSSVLMFIKWFSKQVLSWINVSLKYNAKFEIIVAESTLLEKPIMGWYATGLFQESIKHTNRIREQRIINIKLLFNVFNSQLYNSIIDKAFIQNIVDDFNRCLTLPITFPILFHNEDDAERIFISLIQEGVQVNTWPDLPKDIYDNMDSFRITQKMRMRIVHFPIHQSIKLTNAILSNIFQDVFAE